MKTFINYLNLNLKISIKLKFLFIIHAYFKIDYFLLYILKFILNIIYHLFIYLNK